ncbi:35564_t:CDS:1, partial [Gigaspora margarita]
MSVKIQPCEESKVIVGTLRLAEKGIAIQPGIPNGSRIIKMN